MEVLTTQMTRNGSEISPRDRFAHLDRRSGAAHKL
jgi:hypothetical protein